MERKEKIKKCVAIFEELANLLNNHYEVLASCNQDLSKYLVPTGTSNLVTYYSKPKLSFRISDHWSWYSNLKKCCWPEHIQCFSKDLPYPDSRKDDKATKPIDAIQVCFTIDGYRYDCIYGDKYNSTTNTFEWVENTPEDIIAYLGLKI